VVFLRPKAKRANATLLAFCFEKLTDNARTMAQLNRSKVTYRKIQTEEELSIDHFERALLSVECRGQHYKILQRKAISNYP
jgi:hypothetical protein